MKSRSPPHISVGKTETISFVDKINLACINLPKGNNIVIEKGNYIGGEYREEKKDLEQIHLFLGFKGIDYHHDDFYSFQVFNSLLGEGMSSKLFQELFYAVWFVFTVAQK